MIMDYKISYSEPHRHYLDIEFTAWTKGSAEMLVQLPAWRPGRYELGNFAKNVQKWASFNSLGEPLPFRKISKDRWRVDCAGIDKVVIRYNYFAAELNAGSTYLDPEQLYVNPVNCCVYIPGREDEACTLKLELPESYRVAIAAEGEGRSFSFRDYHELADSPFIASAGLQHNMFVCEGVEFHLWFQGECRPDWSKLNNDFIKFCDHTLTMMKRAPFSRYHFFFQILPHRFYHGVEHTNSTVIALGPGYNLMKGDLYENLLGVSCHELFHAWNVKTIRPVEMQPYDYSRENYTRLGYVTEGVTTYYGDFLLFRSGVFNEEEYFKTLAERLQKHFDNGGRFNLSVADSSFDTWLDGYVPGVPDRKTSIYDEGNLLALVTDLFILKSSGGAHSLDDVMTHLYNEFALKGKGYSAEDYKGIVEHYANAGYDDIFENYINGIKDYEPLLREYLDFVGLELTVSSAAKYHEHALGIKTIEAGGICRVSNVMAGSVADAAGIAAGDEILAINGMQIRPEGNGTTWTDWCSYFAGHQQQIEISRAGKISQVALQPQADKFYRIRKVRKNAEANAEQKANFQRWSKNKF
jgi:predicted metalloprotease with PDZ domain